MLYKDFKGKQLSGLGFGIMRLPTLTDGSIDEARTREMVAYAMESGVESIKELADFTTPGVAELIQRELTL